jgi:hypothetical protein
VAFGEEDGSNALALVTDDGTAVDHQLDGFASLEPVLEMEAH